MSFRSLRRFEGQKAAYDNYKAWVALSPDAKQTAYAAVTDETKRAKPERSIGYISPFNQVGSALRYISIPVLSPTQTGQASDIATALATALDNFYITGSESAPASGAIKVKRFQAAKLSFRNRGAATKKNSRITKRAYLKPDVDTVSAPFGQSVGNQDFAAALIILNPKATTWVQAGVLPNKRSYKFTPEGV
ncbi:MAG: hypothetical protein ACFKPT_25130 [Gloeotrichia echinulata GP01]